MKKRILCLLAFALMGLFSFAAAETGTTGPADALAQAGVMEPAQILQWGDTAVCLAEMDGVKHLIILERQGQDWHAVIDNPAALIQDAEWPVLLADTDSAFFWTYSLSDRETVRYHCARGTDGQWGPVDQVYFDDSYGEYTRCWETVWNAAWGGEIIRTYSIADKDGNPLDGEITQYLPASWLGGCISLADFDLSRFPTFLDPQFGAWFETDRFFRDAAAALMPEYIYLRGLLKEGRMHFLMQRPDGGRVYIICTAENRGQWRLIESTPLPLDTVLGYENFTDSLFIDGCCVTVQVLAWGTAGLEYIYDDSAYPESFLFFGDRTVWDNGDKADQVLLYGDHPWQDITQIDWTALPHSLEEAAVHMDASRYAMVMNPNPSDRLHLREQAKKGSLSQGKYYTGTPVACVGKEGDFEEVAFGSPLTWSRGYMMSSYLIPGQAGTGLSLDVSAMPQLFKKEKMLRVFYEMDTGAYTWHSDVDWPGMLVIGVIGEEWVHVWFPATGEYGYVRRSDLTEGNG